MAESEAERLGKGSAAELLANWRAAERDHAAAIESAGVAGSPRRPLSVPRRRPTRRRRLPGSALKQPSAPRMPRARHPRRPTSCAPRPRKNNPRPTPRCATPRRPRPTPGCLPAGTARRLPEGSGLNRRMPAEFIYTTYRLGATTRRTERSSRTSRSRSTRAPRSASSGRTGQEVQPAPDHGRAGRRVRRRARLTPGFTVGHLSQGRNSTPRRTSRATSWTASPRSRRCSTSTTP